MSQLAAISRERHAEKRWRRHTSYAFAEHTALQPVVLAEVAKAAMSLPLCFARQGESYVPAAVLGLQPERNLFVARDGRWLSSYIPAALRGYPFSLVPRENDQMMLCFDEDSGLLSETDEGELFFNEQGEPAESLRQVLDFLQQIERNRLLTAKACALLDELELIQPWPISLQGAEGEARRLEGLARIDEAALNRLDGATLQKLRDAGGLMMAYCQLLSMQHLSMLGKLAEAHARHDQATAEQARRLLDQPEEELYEFNWDNTGP